MQPDQIKRLLFQAGWEPDRWGNWHKEVNRVEYRVKFGPRVVKVERLKVHKGTPHSKPFREWLKDAVTYYRNVVVMPGIKCKHLLIGHVRLPVDPVLR